MDTLTAYENIALALTIQRVKPQKIQKDVAKIAEELGITAVLNKYPYEMSGGQNRGWPVPEPLLEILNWC